ncbi:hypothetical protein EMIT0P171_250042 [Pseudomonas sp. IT-P171]
MKSPATPDSRTAAESGLSLQTRMIALVATAAMVATVQRTIPYYRKRRSASRFCALLHQG